MLALSILTACESTEASRERLQWQKSMLETRESCNGLVLANAVAVVPQHTCPCSHSFNKGFISGVKWHCLQSTRQIRQTMKRIHPPYSSFACWSFMVRVLLCRRHPGLVPEEYTNPFWNLMGIDVFTKERKSLTFLNEVSISVLPTRKKKVRWGVWRGGITRELCTADKVCEPDVVVHTWSPRTWAAEAGRSHSCAA